MLSTYQGKDKQVDRPSAFEAHVSNDTFSLAMTLTANIKKTAGYNSSKVTVQINDIPVSYIKKYDEGSHSFQVASAELKI